MGRVAGLTSEETRQRVLDAAADVFAEHGFEGARVAQIASAAGLSVGAIYNHYASKAELLSAVVERRGAEDLNRLLVGAEPMGVLDLVTEMGRRLESERPSGALLAEVILAARRDPEVAGILIREVASREDLIADFVRLGQSAGEVIPDLDPATVARFCLMIGLGSLLVGAIGLPPSDPDEWGDLVARLVDGCRAPHSRRSPRRKR